MADSNPYRSPLTPAEAEPPVVPGYSLGIGLSIDGAAALLGALWLSQWPWLRVLLPFAAAHAVAAVLIALQARAPGRTLSAGDHFFLRYGAVMMAAATALARACC